MTAVAPGRQRVEQVMGMPVVIDVRDGHVGDGTIDGVVDRLCPFDLQFSRFKPDSEICGIDRGEHVIDPHTGRPLIGVLSVTITEPDLATADATPTPRPRLRWGHGGAVDRGALSLGGDDDPRRRARPLDAGLPRGRLRVDPGLRQDERQAGVTAPTLSASTRSSQGVARSCSKASRASAWSGSHSSARPDAASSSACSSWTTAR